MIRVLARLVARQVCMPTEGSGVETDGLPPLSQQNEQPPSISHARSRSTGSSPGTDALAPSHWPDPSEQTLVVLFTELAQRRVQAARTQEEIHEDRFHHHDPSRTDGLRLRAAIHPRAASTNIKRAPNGSTACRNAPWNWAGHPQRLP
jgi:hypothetical protein